MTDKEFIELLHNLVLERRVPEDIVCSIGEVGETFYIILQGEVQIFLENTEKAAIISNNTTS